VCQEFDHWLVIFYSFISYILESKMAECAHGNFVDNSIERIPFNYQLLELEKAALVQERIKKDRELHPEKYVRGGNVYNRNNGNNAGNGNLNSGNNRYQRNKYKGDQNHRRNETITKPMLQMNQYKQNYGEYYGSKYQQTQYQSPGYGAQMYTSASFGCQQQQPQQMLSVNSQSLQQNLSVEEPITPFQRQLQSIIRAASPNSSVASSPAGTPQISSATTSATSVSMAQDPASQSLGAYENLSRQGGGSSTAFFSNPAPSFATPSLVRTSSSPGSFYTRSGNNMSISENKPQETLQGQFLQRSMSSLDSTSALNSNISTPAASGNIWNSSSTNTNIEQISNYNNAGTVPGGSINNLFANSGLTWAAGKY